MSLPSVSLPQLVGLPPGEALEEAIRRDLPNGLAAIVQQTVDMLEGRVLSLVRDYPVDGPEQKEVIRILFGDALRQGVERILMHQFGVPVCIAGINCHAVKTGVGRQWAIVSPQEQISWQNGVNGAPDC